MRGKVVVITGGTSGIGQEAAKALASQGARILLVARDSSRAKETVKALKGNSHQAFIADLSSLSDTKKAAEEIAASEPHIDVLINNAGSMFAKRQLTGDGLERTFATNHMSYFVLTHGLRSRLVAGSRVVNTASQVHRGAQLDFDDLQFAKGYEGFSAYGKSKLCNVLFTRELARQWKAAGITANCLHPGVVATRFGSDSGDPSIQRFVQNSGISPEEGAQTIIYLASSKEVEGVTGKYFYQSKAETPSKEAQDDRTAERLWKESLRLAGM